MSQYWMVKQEPTAYSWDQFVADGKTDWTGVRNFQARNNLRSMNLGDPVYYYHSVNGKAIVGIAKVTKEAFPDPTAAEGDWSAVELRPVRPIRPPVKIEQIKREQAGRHAFAEEFQIVRHQTYERAIRYDPRNRKILIGHPMKTLGEIATYVGGQLRGDASILIKRVVHPALAQTDSDLALVLSPSAASILDSGKITNAVLPEKIESRLTPNQIVVSRPRLVLARILELFDRPVNVVSRRASKRRDRSERKNRPEASRSGHFAG